MKFSALYNKVFTNEQTTREEIASPENFDDVEPAPIATPADINTDSSMDPLQPAPALQADESHLLNNYVVKAKDMAEALISDKEGESLLTLLAKLNSSRPGDQFHNVYSSLDATITRASEALSELATQLIVYLNTPKH